MIKFFRRIRFDLMENKTGKPAFAAGRYIKYALSEIILVVIGILIALSINNWNEQRKDRIIEHEILVQLQEEYETNSNELENKINLRKVIINSSIEVLGYIDNPINIVKDSLIKKIAVMRFDPTFDPIKNDLISSGNIRLIQNKTLRKTLSNWSSDVVALQEMEQQWQKIRNETNVPYLINLGIYRDLIDLSAKENYQNKWMLDNVKEMDNVRYAVGKSKSLNAMTILNDKDLESMIGHAINFNIVTNIQANALLERISLILELLKEELDSH